MKLTITSASIFLLFCSCTLQNHLEVKELDENPSKIITVLNFGNDSLGVYFPYYFKISNNSTHTYSFVNFMHSNFKLEERKDFQVWDNSGNQLFMGVGTSKDVLPLTTKKVIVYLGIQLGKNEVSPLLLVNASKYKYNTINIDDKPLHKLLSSTAFKRLKRTHEKDSLVFTFSSDRRINIHVFKLHSKDRKIFTSENFDIDHELQQKNLYVDKP